MAASLQEGEAVPTCSICVDVFRDPVTLPCQHDFCRPCLEMFTEKSKSSTDDSVDVVNTDQESVVTVTCPVCRSPADLGSTGVVDLPTNASLANLVRKFQAEDNTCGQDIPKCSVCEDDNSSPAVKSCGSCNLLYCQDCFTAFHPLRGALKRHDVIPVEDFLSLRATDESGATEDGEVTGESPEDSAHPVPCDKHSQPLSIFCVTCEEVICLDCLKCHSDHAMKDTGLAYHKLKEACLKKTDECTELKDKIVQLRAEMNALYQDIQGNEDAHRDDIERAYTTATEALNCWRRDALEVVEKRHSGWRREWKAAMKDLDMRAEEVSSMIETSRDLVSSLQVMFLQGIKKLKTRFEEQLPDVRNSVKRQEEIKTKMRESVSGDPVIPRRISVKESVLSKPEMKFSETNNNDLKIVDDGSAIEFMGVPSKSVYEAWAGVCLPPGESYWELEIRILPDEEERDYQCTVGVKQYGSDFSNDSNTSCWWMGLYYKADNFHFGSSCGAVTPVYKEWKLHSGSHRLGFYLDSEKRSLTILDCSQNQVTFFCNSIDVTIPLVVAVDFYRVLSASAHLITGDNCIMPQATVCTLAAGKTSYKVRVDKKTDNNQSDNHSLVSSK